jgi:hypothetical protein
VAERTARTRRGTDVHRRQAGIVGERQWRAGLRSASRSLRSGSLRSAQPATAAI